MKKSLLWMLVVLVCISMVGVFSFTGCKEEAAPVEEEAAPAEEVEEVEEAEVEEEVAEEPSIEGKKVGVVLSWATHEWYVSVMDGFKARAEELGIEYTIVDGEGDIEKGVSIMENFVQEGVDGILLFGAGPTGYEAGIDAAYNAGIPVISDPRDMPGTNIIAFGSNPNFNMTRETGQAAAKYIKDNWPEDKEVNVLTVSLPALPTCSARTDGYIIGLIEGGVEVNWLQEVDGGGNLPTSLDAAVVAFTAHPEINVITGINDDSMFGGYKAAEQQGLDLDEMIFIGTGLEGPKARQSLLDDNAHKFDTAMFPATQGYIYVNLFAELFKGNEIPYQTNFPSNATTADNFYDYFNEDLSENMGKIAEIEIEISEYPATVGWDRGWYEVYKSDIEKFKEEYKY